MTISHMEVPMKIHQPASAMEDASQGARRATEEASSIAPPPDPEVVATAKRRQFSPSERRRILAAADRCSKNGEIGALLRREGIYFSQLATWRKQREATERAGLEPKKRGRKAARAIAQARRVGGASSARPPNAPALSQRSAGAKPTLRSLKLGASPNSPARMSGCAASWPKPIPSSMSKKNSAPYSGCPRPRTRRRDPDGRA